VSDVWFRCDITCAKKKIKRKGRKEGKQKHTCKIHNVSTPSQYSLSVNGVDMKFTIKKTNKNKK
jgi:hypothetical protein